VLEDGAQIVVGEGGRSSFTIPAQATMLIANAGPVVTEGADLKHAGTKRVAAYGGHVGEPVRMTRAEVGPGAPDSWRPAPAVVASGWHETFSDPTHRWWSEGGEGVSVEGGRLQMQADNPAVPGGGAATAWFREPLPDDFALEVDAHVVSSAPAVNNINLFLCYADPTGFPLEETRAKRASADYNLYHALNGYIVTFVNEGGAARIRLRRNPGFTLLAESRVGECRAGVTYRLKVVKQEGALVFSVDGRELARCTDPTPWRGGILGLRTYRTNLWWDNIRVVPAETGRR
jgi:hypothetical protein